MRLFVLVRRCHPGAGAVSVDACDGLPSVIDVIRAGGRLTATPDLDVLASHTRTSPAHRFGCRPSCRRRPRHRVPVLLPVRLPVCRHAILRCWGPRRNQLPAHPRAGGSGAEGDGRR
ncbi:hypothetical protein PBRA_008382 [Plasmodiophora brassicae]|uniref:Uncharacterized protein n=1 Tax=Plasmodiophora brassicae TaxID=37360 RepID=A0A0G4J0F6_PLABS|nr:hypothetical protein PBRA_008382 [Plasmodiophora brassicae]